MKLPLALASYPAKSTRENCSRLINLYSSTDTVGGKTPTPIYNTAGLRLFCDTNGSSVRGMITISNTTLGPQTFVVKDKVFGSLSTGGVFTSIGTINTSTGFISMAATFDQILIATGSFGYLYTISTKLFAQITDPHYPVNCNFVCAQDEFFFAIQPGTDTFNLSTQSDGSTWPALNFASVQSRNGILLGMVSIFQQVWMFKDSIMEIWYDSGGDFPYQRQDGASVNYGCGAAGSIAVANNAVYWLGQTPNGSRYIVTANGNQPSVVSDDSINYILSTLPTISDAIAFTCQLEGHEFYQITFPTANVTLVYDILTSKWHELSSFNNGVPARHYANCFAYLSGNYLVGDYQSGKIYQLLNNVYSDNSNPIIRTLITPPVSNNGRLLTIYSLDLFVDVGDGLVTSQGQDPQIMLQVSKDGGYTWGNEKWRSLGALGTYKTRVKWNTIGTARDFVFKFVVSDPVKVIFLGAEIEIDGEDLTKFPKIVSNG